MKRILRKGNLADVQSNINAEQTGQFLASFVMILGYSILAVPAGLVTATFIRKREVRNSQVCHHCLF